MTTPLTLNQLPNFPTYPQPGKVVVKNLPASVEKNDIQKHFESCGPVRKIILIRNPNEPARNRGYCFVFYGGRSEEDAHANAAKSVELLNGKKLHTNSLLVKLDSGRKVTRENGDSSSSNELNPGKSPSAWHEKRQLAQADFRRALEELPGLARTKVEEKFGRIEKPSRNDWNSLIRFHAGRKDKHRARTAFERMRSQGIEVCSRVYSSLVLAYRRAEDLPGAVACVEEMQREGIRPNDAIFSILIAGFAAQGDVKSAEKWHKEYCESADGLNPVIANNMVHAYCKALMPDKAELLMSSLEARGVPVSLYMFNSLMHGYARLRDVQACFQVLQRIKGAGFTPDLMAYTSLLLLHAQSGAMEEAEAVVQLMQDSGLSPDGHVYSVLIEGYCRLAESTHPSPAAPAAAGPDPAFTSTSTSTSSSRAPDSSLPGGVGAKAVSALRSLQSTGMPADSVVYLGVVRTLCASGAMEAAVGMVEEMEREGVPLDARVLSALVQGWVRAGRVEEALSTLLDSREQGWRVDLYAYNALLQGLLQSNMAEEWPLLRRLMAEDSLAPDAVTFSILIDACAGRGDLPAAMALFLESQQAGVPADTPLYGALLKACCRAGHMDSAERVLHEMRAQGIRPNLTLMNTLLDGWARMGEVWEATKVLQQIAGMGLSPDVVSFSSVVQACCKAGDMERAEQVLEEMRAAGVAPNLVTYTLLMKGWAQASYPERAVALYSDMLASGVEPDRTLFRWLQACLLYRAALAPSSVDDSLQRVQTDMASRGLPTHPLNAALLEAHTRLQEGSDTGEGADSA